MNAVIWARVSSREQKEGYSLDAQLRANRDKAAREGITVVREFVVAESAKRGAERIAFNEMYRWVRENAKRQGINLILAHKLDRICRNMRDAVRMQELEDHCGVKLAFVENQFGPGAAGLLSFNVMAAVAQYYSDNLRTEVLKGIDEKVRQGWPAGLAPFGYMNVPGNHDEPVQPHPEKSRIVIRIFELYARGDMTFESLGEQLAAEGFTYRPSAPRFFRTVLSYILNNRIYVGEIVWRGKVCQGKFTPLIDRELFDACQAILQGKNRRTGSPDHALAGGLFRCTHCGQSITGERIKKRLADGTVKYFTYYRCANNHPGPEHPRVRWREEQLERTIAEELGRMRLESDDMRGLVRTAMEAAFADLGSQQRKQAQALTKRQSELKGMQDRLLNAFLNGTIEEAAFAAKSEELKGELAKAQRHLEQVDRVDPSRGAAALAIFDWSQKAADDWLGSNKAGRREILDMVCLNRKLSDVTLDLEMRSPFRELAERRSLQNSRGDRI